MPYYLDPAREPRDCPRDINHPCSRAGKPSACEECDLHSIGAPPEITVYVASVAYCHENGCAPAPGHGTPGDCPECGCRRSWRGWPPEKAYWYSIRIDDESLTDARGPYRTEAAALTAARGL